jgi:hypothetical protein
MAKLQDYEARRKAEREKEEEELRKLKEKVKYYKNSNPIIFSKNNAAWKERKKV